MKIRRLLLVAAVLLPVSNIILPTKVGATGGSGAGTQSSATTQTAVTAINSATTLSDLNTAVQNFLNQYSVTYSTSAVPDTAVFSTTGLTESNFSQAQSLDMELVQEWSKYTPAWVAASHLQTIYAVTNLHILPLSMASSKRCSSYGQGSDKFIMFDVDCSGMDRYMREGIHHEYAHYFIEEEVGDPSGPVFDESTWRGYNSGGFSYSGGGQACYTIPSPCPIGDHVVTGFATGYATTSIFEDQAETYAYLLTTANYQNLTGWIPADSVLNNKVNRMKTFITAVDPTMDDTYLSAIHTYAAANYSTQASTIANIAPPFVGPGTEYLNPDGDGSLIWDIPVGTTGSNAIGLGLFGKINVGPSQTLYLDGAITGGIDSGVDVGEKGILKGGGTAQHYIKVETGGIVAPGHSPGCLTTNNLIVNGTYQAEIGGNQPCTGYDQIVVTGGSSGPIVATTTAVDVTNGTLDTSLVNSFVPAVGDSFRIVNNQSSDAVTGIFAGLPEGTTFTTQGVTYRISYVGGDGNDIVLTVTNVSGAAAALPKAPNTGFRLVLENPMTTLGIITLISLVISLIARRIKLANK